MGRQGRHSFPEWGDRGDIVSKSGETGETQFPRVGIQGRHSFPEWETGLTQFPSVGLQGRHSSIDGIQGSHSSKGGDTEVTNSSYICEILKRHSLLDETQGHWASIPLGEAKGRHWEDTVLIEDTRDSGYKRGPIGIERTQGRQKFPKLGQSWDEDQEGYMTEDKIIEKNTEDT